MAHKVTYAALTATAIVSAVESQVQLLADMFSPAAYPVVISAVAILGIAVRAWRDWQTAQEHGNG